MKEEIYQAPKPAILIKDIVKKILLRIAFPPILLWDCAKKMTNAVLGSLISYFAVPAQRFNEGDEYDYEAQNALLSNPSFANSKTLFVNTYDGACLETLEIAAHHPKCFIVNFNQNGFLYQQVVKELGKTAALNQATVIGFNYRRVGKSSGILRSKDDLVIDGIAQVQRLLDQKVAPEKIVLRGSSLGGGIATLVAKHFHDRNIPVSLFNDRSFSSVTNFIVGQIRTNVGTNEETLKGKIIGYITKPFIKFGCCLAKWEIEAGKAYKELPYENKEYVCVRTLEKDRIKEPVLSIVNDKVFKRDVLPEDDSIIRHYASLHRYVKHDTEKMIEERFKERLHHASNRQERESIKQERVQALKEERRAKKLYLPDFPLIKCAAAINLPLEKGRNYNAHTFPLKKLMCKSNQQNGEQLFKHFVDRVMASSKNALSV